MSEIREKFGLNSTSIKIIAIVLMVFDHVHQMFLPMGAPDWLTWLGRPVMIMFLFASAESFYYTRDKRAYLFRLLLAAWAMSVLTAIVTYFFPNPNVVLMNNAFMTFFVTGLYMLFWDVFKDGVKNRKPGKIAGAVALCFVPVITALPVLFIAANENASDTVRRIAAALSVAIPNLLVLEGGFAMVFLGLIIYILRKRRLAQIAALAVVSIFLFVMGDRLQWIMIFAAIPMFLYNGEKGRGMKWFFYIFYPAHIYLLYIAATLINGG